MHAPFEHGSLTISERAWAEGYARADLSDLLRSERDDDDFDRLVCASQFLCVDAASKSGNRLRRHGTFIILPGDEKVHFNPAVWDDRSQSYLSEYSQPKSLNQDDGDRVRVFAALTNQTTANPILEKVIRHDLRNAPLLDGERRSAIFGNVHLVRLEARPGSPAVASPNVVHRDGEPVTWVHLLDRKDVSGGENFITHPSFAGQPISAVPRSGIKATFVLEKPLESYVIRDNLVAHSVEAVHVTDGAEFGWRTVLLIDFTPMKPQILIEG